MRMMKYTDRGLYLPVQVGVAGKFRLQVYRPDGRCRHDTGWFDNIVNDAGLNLMGTGSYLDFCQVGSGSATPVAGDTALGTYVAGTGTAGPGGTTQSAEGTAPYFGATTKQYRFAAGDAAGNLSEVGIGTAASGGTLFSRALILDGGGSPTTITVLADDFLDVTYQIQSVPPTSVIVVPDVTDSGPAGTVHAITLRAANVTSVGGGTTPGWANFGQSVALLSSIGSSLLAYDGAIGAITGEPSGTSDGGSPSNTAYSNNSLERLATATWGLDDGNFGSGIKSIRYVFRSGGGTWQAEFDPVISKTNTDTLNIDLSVSWTRTTAL